MHLVTSVVFLIEIDLTAKENNYYTCWKERIKFCFLVTGFHTGSLGLIKIQSDFYKKGEIFVLALSCGWDCACFGSDCVGSVSLEQGCPTSYTTNTRNLSKPLMQLLIWSPERMLC